MATLLQKQYCGVFTDPTNPRKIIPPRVDDLQPGLETISDIEFDVLDIEKAIDELKPLQFLNGVSIRSPIISSASGRSQ